MASKLSQDSSSLLTYSNKRKTKGLCPASNPDRGFLRNTIWRQLRRADSSPCRVFSFGSSLFHVGRCKLSLLLILVLSLRRAWGFG